jgi:P27 family predicted phage terminase small subunit
VRGRKPKPTHLKLIEGNPGKRKLNKGGEPKPPPIAPECPAWLMPEAQQEWGRIAPQLEALGLLTLVDGAALAAYCQAFARWKQAETRIVKRGLTMKTPNGEIQRPEVAIAQKSVQIMKAFLTEFGLTPSSRTRLNIKPTAGKDPMEKMLDG